MVKEFELVNVASTITNGDGFEGTLSNNGDTLTIDVNNVAEVAGYKYQMTVLYANIDHNNNNIEYETLLSSVLTTTLEDTEIDISSVKALLTFETVTVKSATINVDLFTYEANINTDYGRKRISFPHKVTSDNAGYNMTTDGIFIVTVHQIPQWSNVGIYNVGDLVYVDDVTYMATKYNSTMPPSSSPEYWTVVTEDIFSAYAQAPDLNGGSSFISHNLCLNTRSIKQEIIIPMLKSTSFSKYDDIPVLNKLEDLINMREAAVSFLRQQDFLRADYTRRELINQYNYGTVGKPLDGSNKTYTNYTL